MGHKSSKKLAEEAAKKAASSSNVVRQEQSKTEPVLVDSTSSASTGNGVRQERSKTEPHASTSSSASIMTECKPAIDALEIGDTNEALRILKQVCLRHESSAAIAHHIQSSVRFASARKTLLLENEQLENDIQLSYAIRSSDRAVLLSPNSFHFAFHYARVLYEAGVYEKAVEECVKALSIDNPIDPAKDTIPGEERLYKDHSTAEERIAYVKKELQELLEKSKIGLAEEKRRNEEQETKMAEEKRRNEEQRKEALERLALKEKMKQELGQRTEIEEEEGKLKDTLKYQQKQLTDHENPAAGMCEKERRKEEQETKMEGEERRKEEQRKETLEWRKEEQRKETQKIEEEKNEEKTKDLRELKENMEEDRDPGHRTEHEEEEGKLKDTSECQRRQVQQKQLAEQKENTSAGVCEQ